jgi:cell shape-determining protein MreC
MMNYLRQDNPQLFRSSSRISRWLLVIVVAAVASSVVFPHFMASLAYRIVSPLWRTEQSADLERAELLRQIQAFATVDEKIKILESENEELKARLGRDYKGESILAVVLKHPPAVAYDSLIIDAGEAEGVVEGHIVSIFGGDPVGFVETVSTHSSRVKLYSTPGYELDVLIGEKKLPVGAIGVGGGNYTAKVPHDLEVAVGDAVVLPSIVPSILGIVETIVVDPSRSFKILYFKSPVAISALTWVEILK